MALPRIEEEGLPPDLAELLAPRVERLGYLGEFFKCGAHQPVALGHFVRFTETLKDALPPEVVEVVALTAATVLVNDYERHQHERLCVALGLGSDWVRAVEDAAVDGPPLEEPLRSCQEYVREACAGTADGTEAAFAAVSARLGPEPAVAVAMTAARYVAHSVLVRSFGLAPPVPSIFAGGTA